MNKQSRILKTIFPLIICSSLTALAQNEQKMFWALNGNLPTSVLTWDKTTGNNRIDNGSGTWNNTNITWSPNAGKNDVAWRPGASAIFGSNNTGGAAAGTVSLGASQTVNSLTFNPPVSGTFTLAETGTSTYSITNTTGNITANASALIACYLAGTSGLTLSGTGTITLDSATTFTGTTTINSGPTLVLSNGIANSYTPTLSTPIVIASGGTLSADISNANVNLAGNISGAGTLNLLNAAQLQTFRLYGNNSGFTGSFSEPANSRGIMWSDDLGAGNASNTGSAAAAWTLNGLFGFIEANGAATPTVQLGSLTGTNTSTTLGGYGGTALSTFQIGALGTNTAFAGGIQDNPQGIGSPTIAITKVGTGTLTLSSTSNTYSGATTVNAGTLTFSNAIPSSNTWNVAVNATTSTPASANSGLLTFPFALSFSGKTVNIVLTGSATGFTWTAVSWTGIALLSPTLQVNGVTVTSGVASGGTTVTYSPGLILTPGSITVKR
jgi:autotransporter-associated beta strand protein